MYSYTLCIAFDHLIKSNSLETTFVNELRRGVGMGELEVADGGVEWEGGRMVILATGSRNEINRAGGPIFLRLHLQMGFVSGIPNS